MLFVFYIFTTFQEYIQELGEITEYSLQKMREQSYTFWFTMLSCFIMFSMITTGSVLGLLLFISGLNILIFYLTCILPLDLERLQEFRGVDNIRFFKMGIQLCCIWFMVLTYMAWINYYNSGNQNLSNIII